MNKMKEAENKTLILDLLTGDYEEKIKKTAEFLKQGKIAVIPTETVYGLAASCYDENAVKNIFAAKGRPQDNPLIVHISDMKMLENIAEEIPEKAFECANEFWPGPFTMILKRSEKIPKSVSAGLDTVAVRMPSKKEAHDIIAEAGIPLAAPSANLSGSPSPTEPKYVLADMNGRADCIALAGNCDVGVESTVITLAAEKPRLLRPGAVTLEQLKKILPDIEIDKAVLSKLESGAKVSSPGMKYKHYAPKTETYLIEGSNEKFCEYINNSENCAALCFEEEKNLIKIPFIAYGTEADEATLAKNVFSALRDADGLNVQKLFVHAPSKSGVGLAVYNRLIRASAFRVIKL